MPSPYTPSLADIDLRTMEDAIASMTAELRASRMTAVARHVLATLASRPTLAGVQLDIKVEERPSFVGLPGTSTRTVRALLTSLPDNNPLPLPDTCLAPSVTGAGSWEILRTEPLGAELLLEFSQDPALAVFKLARVMDVEFDEMLVSHVLETGAD